MNKINPITVFVPDSAPADEQYIRTGLHSKGYFPVFPQDKAIYTDMSEGEDLAVRKAKYFEECCDAIEVCGAMAIGEAYRHQDLPDQMVEWCKAKGLPVHIFDKEFNVSPAWK